MDDLIPVLVTIPAPFWLPASKRLGAGALMLRPGTNRISRGRWEAAAEDPSVQAHVTEGTLVLTAAAEELAARAHTPDPVAGLADLTIVKARPWIDGCVSGGTLARWYDIEEAGAARAGILGAIETRLAALEPDG